MLCKVVEHFVKFCALNVLCFSIGHRTFAQEASPDKERGTYRSPIDDLLTVERVSVLPFLDNLQGIYARPIEAHFISLIEGMHRWNYIPASNSGAILSPEELEAAPEKTLQISQALGVDGFFAGQVIKGPSGIKVHISFFLTKDGKLLSQAILRDYKQFDLADLKEQTQRMLTEIVNRIPYSGRVLSRESNRITVNLGRRDGLQVGQLLSVIQIIQSQRHPKFNFLVRTEKEIFGKIKVLKVDETLSFGTVVTEKEKGAIQKNSKIGPLDFIVYGGGAGEGLSLTPSPEEALSQREDGKIAFGKDAQAWQPQAPPTFGQIGGLAGFTRMSENIDLAGVGAYSASNELAPAIQLDGEIWITPQWTFFAKLQQAIIQVNNPRPGSPTKINHQFSNYEAGFGYRFRFGPHVWSPHIEPFLGYFTSKLYSDSSTPQMFTTMNYSGFKFGVRGSTPLDNASLYGVGGEFALAFKMGMTETPVTSGASSTNNLTQFGIFGFKKIGERLKAQVQLDFSMYSTSFSGRGSRTESATNASQRYMTLSAGAYYMF